jgi:hypothetical protein
MKFNRFLTGHVHQVEQISIAGDDQLGVGGQGNVDVMSVVGIARIAEYGRDIVENPSHQGYAARQRLGLLGRDAIFEGDFLVALANLLQDKGGNEQGHFPRPRRRYAAGSRPGQG